MTTKATRDVIDAAVRPIVDGFKVEGDCGTNFALDGIPIGQITPCAGSFTNLVASNFGVSGDIDMNNFRCVNASAGSDPGDYVTLAQLISAVGGGSVGNDFIPAGTIMAWSGSTPPVGWVFCDGQSLDSIATPEYGTLYTAIGTTYGGTGPDDFNVPDLTGRVPVGLDAGSTVTPGVAALGDITGDASVQLTVAQLASHGHTGEVTSTGSASGTTTGGGAHTHSQNGASWCAQGSGDNNLQGCGSSTIGGGNHEHSFSLPAHDHDVDVSNSGGDQPHPNVQPSMALNYIIKAIGGVIDQNVLLADGSIPMESGADLGFSGGGTVTGLPDAPADQNDAASGKYVDDEVANAIGALNFDTDYVRLDGASGNTMTGNINLNNQRITFVPTTPAGTTDAVNSQYVIDEVKTGVNGYLVHLGGASVNIASGPAQLIPSGGGGNTFPLPAAAIVNNAVMALIYVNVFDTTPPPSAQISLVFEPGLFLTEMWVPRWDGVTLPAGDRLAQQFLVPIPLGGPLTWDVSAVGLDGDIWFVGYVKSLP